MIWTFAAARLVNDITVGQICTSNLFADDASVMESNEAIEDLARIERWSIKWLVMFNTSKTVFMIFSMRAI
jgi:hypothetical protein